MSVSHSCISGKDFTGNCSMVDANGTLKIYETTNPKGAETLPPGFVESESDLYQRRLWGIPDEDLPNKPKYLVAFGVGYGTMKYNVNNAVKKFAVSNNFTIVLFHYDGNVNGWDEFDWSKDVIHIVARKQTKWWFAKRFLHPDIVAPYEYIFIWDEDLGVDNFDAEEYIKIARKHGLEISQPAVDGQGFQWRMTERKHDQEIHQQVQEREDWCASPQLPPCAGFVEIMAPVFTRSAWRCAWHMIQNDLVHGWGLDFNVRRCVEPGHEKMGVVDAQWIKHHAIPTLLDQGQQNENTSSTAIRKRCRLEWKMFDERLAEADKAYYQLMGIPYPSSNSTNTTN
ncbi:hypothetical protein LUZ61_012481 [Rhynchospora tenuis]|uniref:Uncharacterized protein n=1 Tax=Rhynchospora tenuis TaxID=198213 RepID=A0AAD6F190_9POAL|nr:hypothetical protein LUZ61_012481 [Rhynchospora tenuis]